METPFDRAKTNSRGFLMTQKEIENSRSQFASKACKHLKSIVHRVIISPDEISKVKRMAEEQKNLESGTASGEERKPAETPDFRLVQAKARKNAQGVVETEYVMVGGIQKLTSKKGEPFMVVRLGRLELLAFPNKNAGKPVESTKSN